MASWLKLKKKVKDSEFTHVETVGRLYAAEKDCHPSLEL